MVRKREQATAADATTSETTPSRPRRASQRVAAAGGADASTAPAAAAARELKSPPPPAAVSESPVQPPPSPAATPKRGPKVDSPGPRARRSARLSLPDDVSSNGGSGDGARETQKSVTTPDPDKSPTVVLMRMAGDGSQKNSQVVQTSSLPDVRRQRVTEMDSSKTQPNVTRQTSKSSEALQVSCAGDSNPGQGEGSGDGVGKGAKEGTAKCHKQSDQGRSPKSAQKSTNGSGTKSSVQLEEGSKKEARRKSRETSKSGHGVSDVSKLNDVVDEKSNDGPKEGSIRLKSIENAQNKPTKDSEVDSKGGKLPVPKDGASSEKQKKTVVSDSGNENRSSQDSKSSERTPKSDERMAKSTGQSCPKESHKLSSDKPRREEDRNASKEESKHRDSSRSKAKSSHEDRRSSRDQPRHSSDTPKDASSHTGHKETSKDSSRHRDHKESSSSSKHEDREKSSKETSKREEPSNDSEGHKKRTESSEVSSKHASRGESPKAGSENAVPRESSKDSSRHKGRGDSSKDSSRHKDREESSRSKDRKESSRDSSKHKDRHESSKDSSRHRHRDSSRDRSRHKDRRESSKERSRHKDRHGSSKDRSKHRDHHHSSSRHSSGHRDRHGSRRDERRDSLKSSSDRKDRRDSSRDRSRHDHRRHSSKGSSERHDRRDSSKSSSDLRHSSKDHSGDRRKEESRKDDDRGKEPSASRQDQSGRDEKEPRKDAPAQRVTFSEELSENKPATSSVGVKDGGSADSTQNRDGGKISDDLKVSTLQATAAKCDSKYDTEKVATSTAQEKSSENQPTGSSPPPGPAGDGVSVAASAKPKVVTPPARRSSSRRCVLAAASGSNQRRGAGRRRATGRATRAAAAPPPTEDSCDADGPFTGFEASCTVSEVSPMLSRFLDRVEALVATAGLSFSSGDGIVKMKSPSDTSRSAERKNVDEKAKERLPTPKRTRSDAKTEKGEGSGLKPRVTRRTSRGNPGIAKRSSNAEDKCKEQDTKLASAKSSEAAKSTDKDQKITDTPATRKNVASNSSPDPQSFPPAASDKSSPEVPVVGSTQERKTPPRSTRSRSKGAHAQPSPKTRESKPQTPEVKETRRSTRSQPQPPSPVPVEPPVAGTDGAASRISPLAVEVPASPSPPLRSGSEVSSPAASADSRSPPLIGVPPPDADDNACSFPSMPFRDTNDNDDSGCVSSVPSAAPVAVDAGEEEDSPTRSDGYSGGDEFSAERSRRQRAPRRSRRRVAACQPPDTATASSSSTVGGARGGRLETVSVEPDGRVSFSFDLNQLAAPTQCKEAERQSPQFELSAGPSTPPVSFRGAPSNEPLAIAGPSGVGADPSISSDDEEGPFLGWTSVSDGLKPVSESRPKDKTEVTPAKEIEVSEDVPTTSFDSKMFVGEPEVSNEQTGKVAAALPVDAEPVDDMPLPKVDEPDADVVEAEHEVSGKAVPELPGEPSEDAVDKPARNEAVKDVDDEEVSISKDRVPEKGQSDESSPDSPLREQERRSPDTVRQEREPSDDESALEPCTRERSTDPLDSEADESVPEKSVEDATSNIPPPEPVAAEDVGVPAKSPVPDKQENFQSPRQEQCVMDIDLADIPLPGEVPKHDAADHEEKSKKEPIEPSALSFADKISFHREDSDEGDAVPEKSLGVSRSTRRGSDLNDNLEKESCRELAVESNEQPKKGSDVRFDADCREHRFESVQYDSDSEAEHKRAVSAAVEAELESNSEHPFDASAFGEQPITQEEKEPVKAPLANEDSVASSGPDLLTEDKLSQSTYDPEHPTAATDESQEGNEEGKSPVYPAAKDDSQSAYDPSQTMMDLDSMAAETLPEISVPPSPVTGDPSLSSPPSADADATLPLKSDDSQGATLIETLPESQKTAPNEPTETKEEEADSQISEPDGEAMPKPDAEPDAESVAKSDTEDADNDAKIEAVESTAAAAKSETKERPGQDESATVVVESENDEKKLEPVVSEPKPDDVEASEKTANDGVTASDTLKSDDKECRDSHPDSVPPDESQTHSIGDSDADGKSAALEPPASTDTSSPSPAAPVQESAARDSADSSSPAQTKPDETRGDQRPAEKAADVKKRPGYVTSPERKKSAAEAGMSTLAKVLNQKFANSRIHAAKIGEKLRNYQVITDNIWLAPKPRETKQQKETRRMVCDCSLTPEELERGERGCGADCLNRLLMIECGSRCPMGDRCGNKRFTRRRYCRTEVFRTDLKGYGLRALQDLPAGAFIYEYVGEVLDMREFRRRRSEYARLKYNHQYFMALRGDTIVDATEKGNDSRFINHSCEPNSETQKWTVNGEIRIGFFTQRPVAAGEEITFDYQLRRYGRKAQRCFCGSAQCRGWIGRKPDEQTPESEEEDDGEEEESGARAGAARKADRARVMRKDAARRELGVEISRLAASGLKSRQHTLQLSRLMVRAESDADRCTLLQLLRAADQPCRRLFLDYHGLRLMWTWMACGPSTNGDSQPDSDTHSLRKEILRTLSVLPIPDRTAVRESRVLAAVERWAQASRPSTPTTPDTDPPSDHTPPEAGPIGDKEAAEISELAKELLTSWSTLKNVFRIPKKERLQRMREHEQEADRGYQTYLEQQTRASSQYAKRGYGCSPERRKRSRESPEPVERRTKKYRAFSDSRLTKEERRKLFTLEVQQEEEQERQRREQERRRLQGDPAPAAPAVTEPVPEPEPEPEPERVQRQQQEELWSGHEQRCAMLGLDPYLTPIFDASFQYYWEPSAGAWQPYTPGDPAVPLVAASGADPALMAALPHHLAVFQSMAAVDLQQAQQYLARVAQGRQSTSAPPPTAARPPSPPAETRPPSPPAGNRPPSPPAETRPPSPPQRRPPSPPPQQPQRVMADQLPQMGLMDLLRAQVTGRFVPDPSLTSTSTTTRSGLGPADSVASIPLPEETVRPRSPTPQQPPLPREPARPPPPPEPEAEGSVRLPPKWRMATDDTGKVYYYHQVTLETRWDPPAYPDSTVADPEPAGGPSYSPTNHSSSASSSESSSSSSSSESSSDSESSHGSPSAVRRKRRLSSGSGGSAGKERPAQPRTPSPVLPEAPPPPRLTAPEDELEEGEIPDVTAAERLLRRLSRRHSSRTADPLLDKPPSPPPESSRSESRRRERRERRQRRADARRERRRDRECERLLRKHRRHQQESTIGDRAPGDEARHIREEAIKRFKAKEEALLQQQEQAARERRRAEAEAEAAVLAKRRKLDPKRSSSSSGEPSAGSAGPASVKPKPTSAAADTSSETAKKTKDISPVLQIKDRFLVHMSAVVVSVLNGFRRPTCKQGRITSTEDFKLLAKKLTHHVLVKELRSVKRVEDLVPSDPVKHKARYYVRKYMSRFGELYVGPSSQPGGSGDAGPASDPVDF